MRQRIGHASLAVAEHQSIVEAVRADDAEADVTTMLEHLNAVGVRITGSQG